MRNLLYFLFVVVLTCSGIEFAQAQEPAVKRSAVVENYKGKPFYIHFVSAGETLTAIAKAYRVSTDEIIAENPVIDNGLKADMVIRIPVKSGEDLSGLEIKQPEKKSDPTKNIGNTEYTMYTVKKQETLYGISKQFNTTVDEILKVNPGLEVLKEGMDIKIPKNSNNVKPAKTEVISEKAVKPRTDADTLVVETGETLYSISKTYNTTVDELIDLNPQLSGGLKAGMVIRLRKPAEKKDIKPSSVSSNGGTVRSDNITDCFNAENLNKKYKIALLLPFALDDTFTALDAPVENDPSTYENFNYFQFYAGFMLAADTLEKYGLKASIQVLDADKLNDTLLIRQTLRKPGMDKMDILIGPMYAASFSIASRFAEKHKIGIVNPLSRREAVVEGNPYVIKTQVSSDGIAKKLLAFIIDHYQGANIIAVQNDKKELKSLFSDFSGMVNESIANRTFTGTFSESVFSTEMISGVSKKLKSGVKNIVIMFSNNKTAVPNFVSLLNPHSKSNDIVLVGMDAWDELELETEFLVNLNYHQLTTNFIDYDNESIQQFVTRFRNKYGAVPLSSKHAFLGYDIGMYFLTSLMWYGDEYIRCLPAYKGKGLQYNFDFGTSGNGNGLQNNNIDIIRLQDYKMVKLD